MPTLPRPVVPALEAILGTPFKVLDDGFVRVVDYMGDDSAIVQAARVSYGAGTKKLSDDRALIRYLMRHAHTTPFEMCEMKLHVRVPMDCWRQWIRHRTASVNEYSTRYSEAIAAAQKTDPAAWRAQTAHNRQGSAEPIGAALGTKLSEAEALLQKTARAVYEERLRSGVAREQARKDLPLSTYTEAYWKIDLHNLLHFLHLRMDDHAQQEIRAYAATIGKEIVAKWCPFAWEAFLDYRFHALRLSRLDTTLIQAIVECDTMKAKTLAMRYGFLTEDGLPRQSRERSEFEEKIRPLGLAVPWGTPIPSPVGRGKGRGVLQKSPSRSWGSPFPTHPPLLEEERVDESDKGNTTGNPCADGATDRSEPRPPPLTEPILAKGIPLWKTLQKLRSRCSVQGKFLIPTPAETGHPERYDRHD